MKPQFATPQAWEQADCLMQPALIRTIDQLRQALETIKWRSRYEEIQDPFDIPEGTILRVPYGN